MDAPRGPNQDPKYTAALANALGAVFDLRERYDELVHRPPSDGSRAASDLRHPLGEDIVLQALSLWVVAADHAVAWHDLLTRAGLQPMRAHGTLLRGCLESAVVCRWLVDPTSDQDERLRRSVGLLVADYVERGKFEASTKAPGPLRPAGPGKPAKEREADLRKRAAKDGIAIRPPLDSVTLFERYSVGGWLYRLLSAFAHGRQWVLLASDRADMRQVAGLPGAAQGLVTADDRLSLAATQFAMRALREAMSDLEAYYG